MRFLQLNSKASRTIYLCERKIWHCLASVLDLLFYNAFASFASFLPSFTSFITLLFCTAYCVCRCYRLYHCCTVSALRKILKKHDKQMRDNLIATKYLGTRAKEKYSFLRQLYHNESILSLVASLKRSVRRKRT